MDIVAAKRTIRYLKDTIDYGITDKAMGNNNQLLTYSDAEHGGDRETKQSATGVICIFSGEIVSWLSQRQSSVAISTTEAELVAASEATREVIWLKNLLQNIADFNEIPVL